MTVEKGSLTELRGDTPPEGDAHLDVASLGGTLLLMSETTAHGEVYVGAAIELESERAVFADLASRLDRARVPYVIFANFHIGGRQIDSLVAIDGGVSLFEVKQSRAPVRGDLNGAWERLDVSGVCTSAWGPDADRRRGHIVSHCSVRR